MAEVNSTANFDAERMNEEISEGHEKAPQVNVESDYERSKQYDVADIDKSGQGEAAAQKVTAHQQSMPEPEDMHTQDTGSDSNPEDYREMAKEVNPRL